MSEEKTIIDGKEYSLLKIKSVKINDNEDNNQSIIKETTAEEISFTVNDLKDGTIKLDIKVDEYTNQS